MKNIFLRYIGIGLLMNIAFNIVLFVISLSFGFEDSGSGPTLLPATLFALLMGLVVFYTVKILKPRSSRAAFIYSTSWSVIVLVLTLITTLANNTTNIFFGEWFNYLVFVAMAVSPALMYVRH